MSGVTTTFQRQTKGVAICSAVLRVAVGNQQSPANESGGSAGLSQGT